MKKSAFHNKFVREAGAFLLKAQEPNASLETKMIAGMINADPESQPVVEDRADYNETDSLLKTVPDADDLKL